ncbi:MAG TPA: YgaP-like transmembrane domain [Acidimicrobiales bacterium]|nr:YgaP-like transmembrane domain [Acidimicrobiales bacterium]
MGFFRFMNTTTGRGARIAAGMVMVIGGLVAGGATGWAVAIVGLVPLVAGLLHVCLVAPLFPTAFRGGSDAV